MSDELFFKILEEIKSFKETIEKYHKITESEHEEIWHKLHSLEHDVDLLKMR